MPESEIVAHWALIVVCVVGGLISVGCVGAWMLRLLWNVSQIVHKADDANRSIGEMTIEVRGVRSDLRQIDSRVVALEVWRDGEDCQEDFNSQQAFREWLAKGSPPQPPKESE